MARNDAIGSGAVVLTTSADGLVAGLNKANADVNNWAKKTQTDINKTTDYGSLKGAAKGLKMGEAGELGLTGAVIALGTAIARTFSTHYMDQFNAGLERSRKLVDEIEKSIEKHNDAFLKRIDANPNLPTTRGEIEERLGGAKHDAEGATRDAREAREKLDAIRADMARAIAQGLVGWIPGMKERFEQEIREAEKNLDEAEKRLQGRLKTLEELQKRLNAPAAPGSLGDRGEEADNFGKAQEAAKKLQEDTDALTESLRIQAETYGQTGTAAEIAALRAKGASDLMLAEAEARAKHLKELEGIMKDNGPKLAGAIEAGSQEAFAATLNAQGFDLGNANEVARDSNKKLEKIAESNRRFEKLMENTNEGIGALNAKWEAGF